MRRKKFSAVSSGEESSIPAAVYTFEMETWGAEYLTITNLTFRVRLRRHTYQQARKTDSLRHDTIPHSGFRATER